MIHSQALATINANLWAFPELLNGKQPQNSDMRKDSIEIQLKTIIEGR
jgi:hypothetical protein